MNNNSHNSKNIDEIARSVLLDPYGIDDSDLCLLVGTDIKKEAPTLSSRIRQRFLSQENYSILRVGKNFDVNFRTIDIGESSKSLKILNGTKYNTY